MKSDKDPCLDKMSISVRENWYWLSKCVSSAAANSYTEACTPSWQSASNATEKAAVRLQPSSSKVSLYSSCRCLSVLWHNMVLIVKRCHFILPRRIWHRDKIPLTSFPNWASPFLLPAASTPQWLVFRCPFLPVAFLSSVCVQYLTVKTVATAMYLFPLLLVYSASRPS